MNPVRTGIALVLLTFLVSLPTAAQTDECAAVLQLTGNNVRMRESSEAVASAQAEQFCDETYQKMSSSQQQDVEASFKLFAASYSSAGSSLQEFRHNYCKSGHQTFTASSHVSEYARQAVTAAIEAWQTCDTLRKANLLVSPAGDDRIITFALTNRTAHPEELLAVQSNPPRAFECRALGQASAPVLAVGGDHYSLQPGKPFSVSCTRAISVGGGQETAPPASITLTTSVTQTPYFLRFPALAQPDLQSANAAALSAEISSLSAKLQLLTASRLLSASIDGASPSVSVLFQRPSWIAGIRRRQPGLYDIQLVAEVFSSQPVCVCSPFNYSATSCSVSAPSATQLEVHTIIGRDLVDEVFSLLCTNSR